MIGLGSEDLEVIFLRRRLDLVKLDVNIQSNIPATLINLK